MKNIFSTFLLVLVVFFTAHLGYGQNYTFKVMASSNNPLLKATNKPLMAGASVQATDNIVVPAKGYISLAHKSGGTVQISKAGTYSVADLEKNMLASRSSASGKLASYIINEVSKGQDDNINKKKYAYMNVTGSVERATKSLINVHLPKDSKIYDNKITLTWESVTDNKNYVVTFLNEFNDIVKKISTQDTSIQIDFNEKDLQSSEIVSIVVLAKEKNIKNSEAFGLKRSDTKEVNSFKKMYDVFVKEHATENNAAFAKLAEAMFFEEHEYYLDALRCYNEAIVAAGEDAEPYIIARDQYRIRRGIGTLKEVAEASGR